MIQNTKPLVVTISRQLGSGGGFIGKRLSARLNAMYLDKEILQQAAGKLKVSEQELESLDEKTTPFWQSILLSSNYAAPTMFTPSPSIFPSDQDLFRAETEIITHISEKHSAVVVGRGGWFILRNHPRHVSVFLYADVPVRCQRIQERFNFPKEKTLKMVEEADKVISRYIHTVIGCDIFDARQYDLCLDTGVLELSKVETLIIDYLQSRFGPLEVAEIPDHA
jgi:CMP/dCMP kinase